MRSVICSKGQEVFIDDEDYPKVSVFKWYLAKSKAGLYYARTTARVKLYLHRVIMDANKDQIVDHIDGNTLNCQKSNLRFATSQQNAQNKKTSTRNKLGLKGVSFDKTWNKYVAQLVHSGVLHRKWFNTPEEASIQYMEWSNTYHKEFGKS